MYTVWAFPKMFMEIKFPVRDISVAIFIGTVAVLYFLQPFDIKHGQQLSGILRVLSYGLSVSMTFWLLERFVKKHFIKGGGFSYFIWIVFELIVVTTVVFVCKALWVGLDTFTIDGYITVISRVLAITFIFITFTFLFFFIYQRYSKKRVILKSTDKNEHILKVNLSSVLALINERNYTTVYYVSGDQLKKEVLRGSLNHFEKSLEYPLVRIHRSHIINFDKVENISGNSQGKQVKVESIDAAFKVSRSKLDMFDRYLNKSKSFSTHPYS